MSIPGKYLCFIAFSFLLQPLALQAQRPADLPVDSFENAIAAPQVQILDVRTAGEYQGGHLKNSMWADWNDTQQFELRTASLDKSMPVYTYCLSGGRSRQAADRLREQGFTVYNMAGGIVEWKKAGKPVEGMKNTPRISLSAYLAMIPGGKTVLVDFGAVWCPPCRKMKPVLDSLQRRPGSEFVLLEIDGGEQTGLLKDLNIDGFPIFIVYKKGKETWRKEGIVEAAELVRQL